MAIQYKELVAGATLTGTAAPYYGVPALSQMAIHAMSACNTTGAPVTVNIYRVAQLGSGTTANRIASRVVPANSTVSIPDAINHKFAAGSQIFADGVGCTLNASGVEYIPGT